MTTPYFPAPGTEICGCDDDAACSFHAEQLYKRMQEPDINPLQMMLAESRTNKAMRQAVLALYGEEVFPDDELRRLAKMDSREVYGDSCNTDPEEDCEGCPACRM